MCTHFPFATVISPVFLVPGQLSGVTQREAGQLSPAVGQGQSEPLLGSREGGDCVCVGQRDQKQRSIWIYGLEFLEVLTGCEDYGPGPVS